MPKISLAERQESLLTHLESVYLLAQAISPDAETAAGLVEATYTQAFITLPLSNPARNEKRWLFRLLMQIRHEQTEFERLNRQEDDHAEPPPEALKTLRQRLARQIADRALPTILATLSDEQRLILLLCDAEGLSSEDAGFVLTLPPPTAFERLEQARAAVQETMQAGLSERERRLLSRNLPEDWLRHSLRRTVEAEFDLPPMALRHGIVASTAHVQAEPEPPEPAALPTSPPPLPPAASPEDPAPSLAAPAEKEARPRLGRLVVGLVLITTVAVLGFLASRSLNRPPETNLITLSVKQADAVRLSFKTDSPEQAESYVWDQLMWRLTLPTIDQATLRGVGLREVVPGITVPVFLYEDTDTDDTRRIALYVFSYALLDRHNNRIQLEPEILRQIQDDQRFDLHDLGERNVLVWRNRDDIYLAVTPGDPEALRQRIVFPS